MIHLDLLTAKIDASGLKQRFIAEQIGMSDSLLTKILKGEAEFKASEIVKLANLLHLSDEERLRGLDLHRG